VDRRQELEYIMPFNSDSIQPTGGLNRDLDLSLVPKGDYIDALNVQHITEQGSTGYAIQNSKGNLFRFTIPATTTQYKKYRVLIQTDGVTARELTFYKTDGSVWFVVNYTDNAVFATAYANFATAISAAFAAAVPVQTGTTVNENPYGTVEISTSGVKYDYTVASTGANATTVEIVAEAITESLAGEANVIGSFDLLGNLFIWSTPTNKMPSVLSVTITNASNPASPSPIVITTSGPHGLSAGDEVVISGVTGQLAANGRWIAIPGSSTQFSLWNSIGSGAYTGGGTITINSSGVGEIGVANYDPNTNTFPYTKLIRSKEFNFRTAKQINTYCEANNFQKSLYWTDDYNIPRVLYYKGLYATDGAINAINSDGLYAYGSIADETKLILTNELIGFLFTGQQQGGGGLLSGNWRYSVRLLTSTFEATNWTELSNPVNVYKANFDGSVLAICGDDAGVTTSKINQFTVSGLPVGVFAYIELAAINYVGTAIVGSVVKRIAITNSVMRIDHTGNEANVTNLDLSTINQFSFDIQTAKNIDAIDNRLILSNLTTSQEVDFSDFARTFTHSVSRTTIELSGFTQAGEYQDPMNVFNSVGYMIYDTYRFGVRFRMKSNGSITKVFYVDDIKIDDSATNITVPDRRVAGLPDLNLTSIIASSSWDTYVPYVQFSGIDLDYLIDGVKIRDLVSDIIFERVERIPEILATGALALTVTGVDSGTQEEYGPGGIGYGENPYISGFDGVSDTYPSAGFTAYRKVAKLYSPDIFCGHRSISYLSGDVVLCPGNPELASHLTVPGAGAIFDSDFQNYNGYFTTASLGIGLVIDVENVIDGQGATTIGGISYYNYLERALGAQIWPLRGGPVIVISNTFATSGANPDYGLYYAMYYRELAYTDTSDPNTCKYGNINENVYIPTGAILHIDGTTASPASKDVFGGDSFIQKNLFKT
jgi:hypothetical protein